MIVTRRERFGDVERLHASTAVAGRPLYWTSCYRLPAPDGDVLVDALAPRAARLSLDAWERAPAVVLVTHQHEDHSGGAAVLAQAGARVLAPEGAVPILARAAPIPLYRTVVWGRPTAARVEAVPAVVATPAGRFRAVESPGHSPDHRAFLHEETGALFTGDAYFGRLSYVRPVEDIPTWIESLRALAALGPTRAFPAHGPVVERPREAFEGTADWLETLARKAKALRSRGKSVREIRRDLLGLEGTMFWISGGDFSKMNLVRSLLTL